jgi:hypothetical protein
LTAAKSISKFTPKQEMTMKKLFLIILIAASSCTVEDTPTPYEYRVSGTSGSYSVTLQNAYDNTQQYSNVGNGWWYKWTQTGGTRWLYVSAQNNKSTGNVTVQIVRAGKVVASNTSYGGYTIATVSGRY